MTIYWKRGLLLVLLMCPVDLAVGANAGIMWGINGHPVQGGPYTAISPAKQMADIATAGLRSYRMDLYDASAASQAVLQTFVTAGAAKGVQILPVLIPDYQTEASEASAYATGFALAKTYATDFPAITVWELGNEYETRALIGDVQGSDITKYDPRLYALGRGMTRGMLDGMRAGNPTAKGIVGTAGFCNFGWLNALWADGLRWDITGEHWYSGGKNIQAIPCMVGLTNKLELLHTKFGKPIWITEWNYNEGSSKTAMASLLTTTMSVWNAVAQQYDIEAAHIYELYDQPGLAGMEAVYGIASSKGVLNAAGTAVSNYLAQHPSVVNR